MLARLVVSGDLFGVFEVLRGFASRDEDHGQQVAGRAHGGGGGERAAVVGTVRGFKDEAAADAKRLLVFEAVYRVGDGGDVVPNPVKRGTLGGGEQTRIKFPGGVRDRWTDETRGGADQEIRGFVELETVHVTQRARGRKQCLRGFASEPADGRLDARGAEGNLERDLRARGSRGVGFGRGKRGVQGYRH